MYVEEVVAPSLRPGDIVVMDNLSAHKSQKVEEIINSCDAELRFLPPSLYSRSQPYREDVEQSEANIARLDGACGRISVRCN